MRKIILASASKARQKILRQIGLTFTVAKSPVKESTEVLHGRYHDLVIHNALLKAQAIAQKKSTGVIIGADTVVVSNRKIIGKPSTITDAINVLCLISQKPQWVYTGIAVIDIDQKKILTDYDKTKIYMQRLNKRQIKKYFKYVCPFDKAGGFDIQGLGAIFIDRIEGCFYNVVGLPLVKLVKLLKKIDITIL